MLKKWLWLNSQVVFIDCRHLCDIPRHCEPENLKKHEFRMIAPFVASYSKPQFCKITRETTKNVNFPLRGPTPTLNFWYFFWLEWFLMGQRTACLVTLMYFLEKWAL